MIGKGYPQIKVRHALSLNPPPKVLVIRTGTVFHIKNLKLSGKWSPIQGSTWIAGCILGFELNYVFSKAPNRTWRCGGDPGYISVTHKFTIPEDWT